MGFTPRVLRQQRMGYRPPRRSFRLPVWAQVVTVLASCVVAFLVLWFVLGDRGAGRPRTSGPGTLAVRGTVLVRLSNTNWTTGQVCTTPDGYGDIAAGAQVTVTDGNGHTVALATLSAGRVRAEESGLKDCAFGFTARRVPAGRRFYGIQVADRNTLRYREAELGSPVTITLGI